MDPSIESSVRKLYVQTALILSALLAIGLMAAAMGFVIAAGRTRLGLHTQSPMTLFPMALALFDIPFALLIRRQATTVNETREAMAAKAYPEAYQVSPKAAVRLATLYGSAIPPMALGASVPLCMICVAQAMGAPLWSVGVLAFQALVMTWIFLPRLGNWLDEVSAAAQGVVSA